MKNWIRIAVFAGLLLSGAEGCKQTSVPCTKEVSQTLLNTVDKTRLQVDTNAMDAFLAALNPPVVPTKDDTGLRYIISQEGTGKKPCLESSITVKYTGKLFNGTQFDASTTGVTFTLNNLILGWQVGFLKLGAGSKATFYIPSGLGYGPDGSGKIPPNANLIFEVELIAVN